MVRASTCSVASSHAWYLIHALSVAAAMQELLSQLAKCAVPELQAANGKRDGPGFLSQHLQLFNKLLSRHPTAIQAIVTEGVYQSCIDFLGRTWVQQPDGAASNDIVRYTACQQLAAVHVGLVATQAYQQVLAQPDDLATVLLATAIVPCRSQCQEARA
jgi:hypothetical protein